MGLPRTRILVVDVDTAVAQTLVMVLAIGGFDAVAAHSAEEAIALAEKSAFDVLLSDVVMEAVNGIQIAIAVRALQPAIQVVLFSGSDSASPILREAIEAGHDFPILAKPLHPAELLSHLRKGVSSTATLNPHLRPPSSLQEP